MKSRTVIWPAGLGLAVAVLLSSCGNDSGNNAADTTSKSDTDDASQEQIMSAQSELGTILVDEEGKTLYIYTPDSPGKSTCEGGCLAAWPAVPGDAIAGEGVDESLLGTIERSDGSTQTTYADWPLYYFAQDKSAGDVNGQGASNVWYVLSPEGAAIKGAADTGSGY